MFYQQIELAFWTALCLHLSMKLSINVGFVTFKLCICCKGHIFKEQILSATKEAAFCSSSPMYSDSAKRPSSPATYSVYSNTLLLLIMFQITDIVINYNSNDCSKLTCLGRERVNAKRKQNNLNLSLTGQLATLWTQYVRYVTIFGSKSGHSGRGRL